MRPVHADRRMARPKIADEADRKAGSSSRTLPLSGEGRLPRNSGQAGRGQEDHEMGRLRRLPRRQQQDKSDKTGHPNRRNYFRTVQLGHGEP